MSKNAQVLCIEPANELVFRGFVYHVKTTAPKQYCVRPNSGVINPGATSSVAVMLQPFDSTSSNETEPAKHKFMVQSAFAPPGEMSLDTIWKKLPPSELMDSKLRVVFEQPTDSQQPKEHTTPLPDVRATPSDHTSDADVEVQRALDERQKAEDAMVNLERENAVLKARLAALESVSQVPASGDHHSSDTGIAIVQVAMIALAALLVGLIFGKLF
ncbi:Vesicle-associated membrane protein-associated protein A [Toxocara canis]|uniref:Major sperm protein n=1 Tax=Toxocara canis TaxID=6265 RepID=A0A0B2VZW5_TOXCA|nr:Vesicle-associated membrane protein-associated protein A [Toxocara canis]